MAPVWIVGLATTAAALTAALGAVPFREPRSFPTRNLGWANATAAGLMLGVAFVLASAGLDLRPLPGMAGAVVGILFVLGTHSFMGTEGVRVDPSVSGPAGSGGRILVVQVVHGSLEGVAVGVAAVLSLTLGLFLALAFAVHNVAEGMVLCSVLRGEGQSMARSATLAVVSNVGQVLLAVTAFALLSAGPGLVPAAVGFATGALVYLVAVDLLPEAYEQAGEASIALVTSLVMGVILLLQGTILP